MKLFFALIIFCHCFNLYGTATGHYPTTSIGYGPPTGAHNTAYTISPNGRQSTLSLNAQNSIIPANGKADIYVVFEFNTSGKNVFIVYTTNNSEPTKSNNLESRSASFSYDNVPDRWWLADIPSLAQSTTVKYVIYISDSDLASAWGKIDANGYATTWDESNNVGFSYVVEAELPIELSLFDVAKKGRTSELKWSTASENNNSHFEVQRSSTSNTWDSIGRVTGHGNSLEKKDYQFIDADPRSGINYYRLKQVDFDGRFEYSKVVSIDFEKENKAVIYPNPVDGILFIGNIKNIEGGLDVFIYDNQNRLIKNNFIQLENDIAVGDLLPGIYFIKIKDHTGTNILNERFVKK